MTIGQIILAAAAACVLISLALRWQHERALRLSCRHCGGSGRVPVLGPLGVSWVKCRHGLVRGRWPNRGEVSVANERTPEA